MSQVSAAPLSGAPTIRTIPVGQLAPWALLFGVLAVLVIFFLSAAQGAVSLPSGSAVHEWTHDARHLLGYPCH